MLDLSVRRLTDQELRILAQIKQVDRQRNYAPAIPTVVRAMLVTDFDDLPLSTRLVLGYLESWAPTTEFDPTAVFWWSSFVQGPAGVWGWSEILIRMTRKWGLINLDTLIDRWDSGVPLNDTVANNHAIRL